MEQRTDIRTETLLHHAAFLRSIAKGLLFDHEAAEDVVQDTWKAAIEQPPRKGTNLRAWLAGVTRNLARQRARAGGRRMRRELAAAQREAVPSASESVERLEILERVVAAVRGLDEPYRTAILLRYYDGLTPSEMAIRQGIPRDTVRTHLRRALARLRDTLDSKTEGDRASWRTALFPIVGSLEPIGEAVASASFASWIVGMIPSAKGIMVLIGLLAAVATGILWLGNEDGESIEPPTINDTIVAAPEEPDGPRSSTRARESGDDASGTAASSLAPATHSPKTGAQGKSWLVRGVALRADRTPFAGAEILAAIHAGHDTKSPILDEWEVVAGADGVFTVSMAQPEGIVTLRLTSRERSHVSSRPRRVILPGDPPPDSIEIVFTPADGRIRGRVANSLGGPLPGARVWNAFDDRRNRDVTTGDDGTYELPVPCAAIEVHASASGYGERSRPDSVSSPEVEARIDFRLEPEMRVHGRILDEEGQPVAGARIGGSTTADTGRYEVTNLDPRTASSFVVRCEGYVPVRVAVPESGLDSEVDVTLRRGVRLEGVFLDTSGKPIVRGSLILTDLGSYLQHRTISDRLGRFTVPAALPGGHDLLATSERGTAIRTIQVPDEPSGIMEFVLQLAPEEAGHFVAGTVSDVAGNPVEEAWVLFRGAGLTVDYLPCRDETDASGCFRVEGLPAGGIKMEVYKTGFLRHYEMLPEMDRNDLRVTLRPAAILAGRLVDDRDDEALERFRIRLVPPELEPGDERSYGYSSTWEAGVEFRDTGGVWETGATLEAGKVIGVEASAPGYAPAVRYRVVIPETPNPDALIFRLVPAGIVLGRVLDAATGDPVAGARVKLCDPEHRIDTERARYDHYVANRGEIRMATSDNEGRFRIDKVPTGEHSLVVQHSVFATAIHGPFDIRTDGEPPERVVYLASGGRISGIVLDAEERSVADARVSAFTHDPRGVLIRESVVSGPNGQFEIPRLPAGDYSVGRLDERGRTMLTYFLRLAAGEERQIRLSPIDGTAVVRVTVEYDGDLPGELVASLIEVDPFHKPWDERFPIRYLRLSERDFDLAGLAAGTYNLSVGVYPFLAGHAEVTLADGELRELVIRLEKR